MWIGVDDTDGPGGGCTTFVLTEIVRAARPQGFDLIGLPRLVRLDPNVPWKTRGNAALAARFGRGIGASRTIGEIDGHPVRAFARGRALPPVDAKELFRLARSVVARRSVRGRRADPAVVLLPRAPSSALYDAAVREVVPIGAARRAIHELGGLSWVRGSSRGLVGATAAVAWPGRRRTFELLAYRAPNRIGRPREIDPGSVRRAARAFPSLFQSYDDRSHRVLVAPHTECPILFGLRGTRAASLPRARRLVTSEAVDRWLLFATNQGTGDHLVDRTGSPWPRYAAGSVEGIVAEPPETLRGGHVRLLLRTPNGPIEGRVFEPTKSLPRVAASLRPGDAVAIGGGRGADPIVRVERLVIRRLAPRFGPSRPPRCPTCARPARSRGRGRGFRCANCRRRFPPESSRPQPVEPRFGPGTYDPVPSARRHLHPVVRAPAQAGELHRGNSGPAA